MKLKLFRYTFYFAICFQVGQLKAENTALQRMYNLTNHLIKAESGIRMLVRYTQAPDEPRKTEVVSKNLIIFPHTNSLAEITICGTDFKFDETIDNSNIVKASGRTITNTGYMVGRQSILDSTGKAVGSKAFYWSPQKQLSFTSNTNGAPNPGGWVEDLIRNKEDLGNEISHLCLPQFDYHAVKFTESNGVAQSSAGKIIMTIVSNGATYVDIKFSLMGDLNNYQINHYTYKDSNDLFPATVDCFYYAEQPPQPMLVIHELTSVIVKSEYLNKNAIQNLPDKIIDDIKSPKYRGLFEVDSKGQTQIIGTNRVPVRNSNTISVSIRSGRLALLILSLFSLTSLIVVYNLTRGK